MLQNAYFLGKIGADTAEKEQHFAEMLSKFRQISLTPAELAARAAAEERRCPDARVAEQIRRQPRLFEKIFFELCATEAEFCTSSAIPSSNLQLQGGK